MTFFYFLDKGRSQKNVLSCLWWLSSTCLSIRWTAPTDLWWCGHLGKLFPDTDWCFGHVGCKISFSEINLVVDVIFHASSTNVIIRLHHKCKNHGGCGCSIFLGSDGRLATPALRCHQENELWQIYFKKTAFYVSNSLSKNYVEVFGDVTLNWSLQIDLLKILVKTKGCMTPKWEVI